MGEWGGREKKNSNRTASLARGVWADLENVGRVLILSLSFTISRSFPRFISLSHLVDRRLSVFFFQRPLDS